MLDAAGALLAASTRGAARRRCATRRRARRCCCSSICRRCSIAATPEVQRANVPLGWAAPAFDVLQLEDYDWVTGGQRGGERAGRRARPRRGSAIRSSDSIISRASCCEPRTRRSGGRSRRRRRRRAARGVAATFVWALPQVLRDGFVHFDQERRRWTRSTMCCSRSRWGARRGGARSSRRRS